MWIKICWDIKSWYSALFPVYIVTTFFFFVSCTLNKADKPGQHMLNSWMFWTHLLIKPGCRQRTSRRWDVSKHTGWCPQDEWIFSSDAANVGAQWHQQRQKIRTRLVLTDPQCCVFVTSLSPVPSYITAHSHTMATIYSPASRLRTELSINFETPSKPHRDLWGDESFTAPLQLPPPSSLPHTSACQTGSRANAATRHQEMTVLGGRNGPQLYYISVHSWVRREEHTKSGQKIHPLSASVSDRLCLWPLLVI